MKTTFLSLVALFCPIVLAQDQGTIHRGLKDYDIIQYAIVDRQGPRNIMFLDNNADILLACKVPRSVPDLKKSGIDFNESQRALLETWRLVRDEHDSVKTSFPILDSAQTFFIRQESRRAAARIAVTLAPSVRRLVAQLRTIHRFQNAYTILFSYIVDGIIWQKFEEEGLIARREISGDSPLWSGEVWAMYQPREFSCGTNSISDHGITLKVNWSDTIIRKMWPFVADIRNLQALLDNLFTEGKIVDTTAMRIFQPFNIMDEKGMLTVPVIMESPGDPLFELSNNLAKAIVQEVRKQVDIPSLREKYSFRSDSQALIVFYHEVMWDIMTELESRGLIIKPRAFSSPKNVVATDIGDLIFVVREKQEVE